MSKTINDSNIDLEKFPASKVRQLAKKKNRVNQVYCKTHKEDIQQSTSCSDKSIKTSKNRNTTKQGQKGAI